MIKAELELQIKSTVVIYAKKKGHVLIELRKQKWKWITSSGENKVI